MRPLSPHGLAKQFQSEMSRIGLFVRERKASVTLAGSGTRLRRDLHPLPALTEPGVLPVDSRGKRWCWPLVPRLRSHLLRRVPDGGCCCFPLGAIVKVAFHPGLGVSWGHMCAWSTQPPLCLVQKNKRRPAYFSKKKGLPFVQLQDFPSKRFTSGRP